MAYDRVKIYEQALEVLEKKKCFFVEDLVALMGIHKSTFYDFFPINSDESNEIKRGLQRNRADVKVVLRKKMYDSDNPTAWLGLYKLVCTDEERQMLSMQEVKITKGNDAPLFDLGLLSEGERKIWYKLYDKATGKVETIDIDHEEINSRRPELGTGQPESEG